MSTIKFNLDKTENEYIHFQGQTLQELEAFIYPNQTFKDCCGTITYTENERKVNLSIAAVNGYGVYVRFFDGKQQYLSISDRKRLSNVLDVWGDDVYVSEGLFVSPQLAWQCICELIKTGDVYRGINWITPDELPEEGNYI